jgi:hypothetical protein
MCRNKKQEYEKERLEELENWGQKGEETKERLSAKGGLLS